MKWARQWPTVKRRRIVCKPVQINMTYMISSGSIMIICWPWWPFDFVLSTVKSNLQTIVSTHFKHQVLSKFVWNARHENLLLMSQLFAEQFRIFHLAFIKIKLICCLRYVLIVIDFAFNLMWKWWKSSFLLN